MKTAMIYGPIESIPKAEHSHRGAWAKLRRHELVTNGIYDQVVFGYTPEDVANFDGDLLLYYGNSYNPGGNLNLFSADKTAEFMRAVTPRLRTFVLDYDYGLNLAEKFHSRSDAAKLDPNKDLLKLWNSLELKPLRVTETDRVILGDSHAQMWYPKSSATVLTYPGQTLYAANFTKLLRHSNPREIKELTLVFGNIDIRHHLLRPGADIQGCKDKMLMGVDELQALCPQATIKISALLGIEPESRSVPKSGFYKGTAFYGSRAARAELAMELNDYWLEWVELRQHPDYFFEDKSRYFLTEEVMERPRSVHISWQHALINR